MNHTVLSLCILAIIVSIAIGFKWNIHVGFMAMVFAFPLGIFGLGLNVNKILAFWPTNILFIMIVTTFFYGFAIHNGTMDVLGKKLLSLIRGKGALLIPVTALAGLIISMTGANPALVIGPMVFAMGTAAGINPLPVAICLCLSFSLGTDNPWTGGGGIVSTGLIVEAGFQNADLMGIIVYLNAFFKNCIVIAIPYFIYGAYKKSTIQEQLIVPKMNAEQKKTAALVALSFACLLVPAFLKMLFPSVKLFKVLSSIMIIQYIMPVMTVIALFMKLGTIRDATKYIPMNTVLLIAGMSILIGICSSAGLTDAVTSMLTGSTFPKMLVGPVFVLLAAFLSFFSGGVSVVVPLRYPMVPPIAAAAGLSAVVLYSNIFIGAMASSISPFSSGGAQTLAMLPDPELSAKLTLKMAGWAVINSVICAIFSLCGVWNLIPLLFGGTSVNF